jgi:hypothetical protein
VTCDHGDWVENFDGEIHRNRSGQLSIALPTRRSTPPGTRTPSDDLPA